MINISVVIPTCNRKARLLSLLQNLDQSIYPLAEVIIVDSGEDRLSESDYLIFKQLNIHYLHAEKSVCIQRNKGIKAAKSEWVFLCDDDIEVPVEYLDKIAAHLIFFPSVVAVSGIVMQLEKDKWVANYPVSSTKELLKRYIFNFSIWGEITCKNNFISRPLKAYYQKKRNHIAGSGLPVVTNFSGDYFTTPVYGLGASVIKKEWLIRFPYAEVLDKHGIGDNYGVAINFPPNSIHILNNAFVYHYQEPVNRLKKPLQYYRRMMALDYFRRTNARMNHVKKWHLLWSLTGNLIGYIIAADTAMIKPSYKCLIKIMLGNNDYIRAANAGRKAAEITY